MPLPFRITRTLPESMSHHAALQQRCQIPRMMSSASIVAMTVLCDWTVSPRSAILVPDTCEDRIVAR